MRRGRLLILVGLIILLAVIVVVFVLPQMTGSDGGGGAINGGGEELPRAQEIIPTATPIPMVQIVVAVQELPRGIRIPAENAVQLRNWPAESAPFNALQNVDDVIGKIARIDIPREAPVLSTYLVDNLQELTQRGRVGSDAAAVMPPGLEAISMPMDRLTGVAYALREGDYVDVILSMLFVDVDEEFNSILPNAVTLVSIDDKGNMAPAAPVDGRLDVGIGGAPVFVSPSEPQRPRLMTQRTVQSAWVLRVGDFPIEGSYIGATPTPLPTPTPAAAEGQAPAEDRPPAAPTPKPAPDIITLAVSPQDALVLVWAIESHIPITLALRSATDISQVPTQPVTLEYMMSTFNMTVPDRLPYALEPPLRSIRQVLLRDITLNQSESAVPR